MYSPVGVEKLSQNQISKLLRGQNVRVKHGSGMQLHLSAPQHKKLLSAHRKGAGCCIQLDPYQQDMHRGGEGVTSFLKDVGSKYVAPAVRSAIPVAKQFAKVVAPVAIDAGSKALKDYVAGQGRRPAPKRKGRGVAEDLVKAVAPVAIDVGANALKSYVGKKGKRGGALYPAGYEGRGKIGSVLGSVLGETFIPF
jgi:hypothetical protein